jgi:hypothetical protein
VRRNDSIILDRDMPGPGGAGKPETLHQYDGAYPVSVPAGSQTLRVENSGIDWMYVGYLLKNGRVATQPPLRVLALRGPDTALAWVQNPESEWYRELVQKDVPRPVPPSLLDFDGLSEGRYQVTLWDTVRGAVMRQDELRAQSGRLSVPLPEVRTDLAVKAIREE